MLKTFEKFLYDNHKGKEKAITSKELERTFKCRSVDIREMVNQLRCNAVPICSCTRGYFYAENNFDVEDTIIHLNGRIKRIKDARDGLERFLRKDSC